MLLMVLAPASLGATPHVTVVHPAFKGKVTPWSYQGATGCAKAKTTVAAMGSAKTGHEAYAAWDSAKACSGTYSSSYTSGGIEWTFPFTVATSGFHGVYVDGNFSINESAAVSTMGKCPSTTSSYSWGTLHTGYCVAYADTEWYSLDWITDLTNGSVFLGDLFNNLTQSLTPIYAENSVSVDWGCYNANTTLNGLCFSYNSSLTTPTKSTSYPSGLFYGSSYNNGTLVSGHKYTFTVLHEFYTDAVFYGWKTGSASSSNDFGTGGNGGWLSSLQWY
ncbi:MAG: hypothetical protein ACHQ2Y_09450 [Candidatus Lutacidiplasmatales archaeon]